jgi:hypothetical protein
MVVSSTDQRLSPITLGYLNGTDLCTSQVREECYFGIKLASYGYVFAGKGAVEAFMPDPWHESHTYKLLRRAQMVGYAGLSR